MKRDMDLIRKMLMDLEDGGNRAWEGLDRQDKALQKKHGYHAYLLKDAGLIHAKDAGPVHVSDISTDHPFLPRYTPRYLTWAGHEFLDAARDEERWNKAKGIAASMGGFAVSVMKEVLAALVKEQLKLP